MPETPRTEPAFTQAMQIGIVVPDVEAAVRTYRDVYGIDGWHIMERLRGQQGCAPLRKAVEPIEEDDLFGQFLKQRVDYRRPKLGERDGVESR